MRVIDSATSVERGVGGLRVFLRINAHRDPEKQSGPPKLHTFELDQDAVDQMLLGLNAAAGTLRGIERPVAVQGFKERVYRLFRV